IHDIGGHAHQRQVPDALADHLMRAGMRDQMGEALECGCIAGFEILRHRFGQRHELRHEFGLSQISKKTVSCGPCRWMSWLYFPAPPLAISVGTRSRCSMRASTGSPALASASSSK